MSERLTVLVGGRRVNRVGPLLALSSKRGTG